LAKKGYDITPLNESEYTSIEVNGFLSVDEFNDGFSENTPWVSPTFQTKPTLRNIVP